LKLQLSKYFDQLLTQLRPLLAVAPGVAPPLPPDDQIWLYEAVSVLLFSDPTTSDQV
jgi:hypothetical protein